MRYLGLRREKYNGNHNPGVTLAALIIAIGLALCPTVESNAQLCGDVNGSQSVNVSDIVYLMYYLFNGGSPPVSLDSADVDSILGITNHDAQHLAAFIFTGEPFPYCPPYPSDSILPVTTDTLEIRNRAVAPFASQAKVDLWFKSRDDLFAMSFPFHYLCTTSSLVLDSISYVGTAYQGNLINEDTVYSALGMAAIGIISSNKLTADSGLVASLWFSVTPSADTQFIHIDTTTAPPSNITIFSRRTINTGNKLIAFIPTIVGLSPWIVQSVTPRQNELNASVSTDISARFGYDMDAVTIMETTFVVSGRLSGPHDGVISYDAPTRTATFDPIVDFQPGEVADVILSTGIHYQGGGPIDSGFVWSFNTAARGGTGLFSPQTTHAVGDGPGLLFVSDLDGDGDNDIAVPNGNSGTVSVLTNNGNATFGVGIGYMAGTRPNSIWAADLDKDGDLDLAVANANSNNVSILRNGGSGSFTPIGNYPVATYPSEVAGADLDGDGDIDLATSNVVDSISLLFNNGDASFGAAICVGVPDQTSGIRITDVDNDGDNDLVGARYYSDSIIILKNPGNGAFDGSSEGAMVGDAPTSIAAADLDGDGDNDLAVANVASDNISVLKNQGDGTFAEAVNYDAGDEPLVLAAADLDGDGDIDLAVTVAFSDNVSILRNQGDGTFAVAVDYATGDEPRGICAADLDGDGDNDLIASNYGSDNVSILLNKGDFLVQNTNNVGTSSLRWAILRANASQLRGADTIVFSVSGTIPLASTLPAMIDDSTVILGSTAPGGSGSVILDGAGIAGGGDGLVVQSQENVIEGLTIRNLPGNGITVGGVLSVHNRLTHNLIYNNHDLAIDLEPRGVTDNDVGDGDSGSNDLLNYPEIDSVYMNVDSTFSVYGRAAGGAVVELYLAHPVGDQTRPADSSGHGEAYGYVGVDTADVSGHFTYTVSKLVSQFSVISCIAIDTLDNTSEFGENFTLTPAPLIVVAYSPVNIIITDPNGLHFGKDSLGNLIDGFPPGEASYFESPNDSIVVYHPVLGQYSVTFIAEAGAPMGSTYSSIIKVDGTQQLVIVDDNLVPISGTTADYTYEVIEGYHYANGDANRDAAINLADAVYLINYVFKGGSAPDPANAGDANCDLAVNLADAVKIINYVFKGDTPPCDFEP